MALEPKYEGMGWTPADHRDQFTHDVCKPPPKEPTIGDKRVRASFNPSSSSAVDGFKMGTAALIDALAEVQKAAEENPHNTEKSHETARLCAMAMSYYELGCMLAVKAVTT